MNIQTWIEIGLKEGFISKDSVQELEALAKDYFMRYDEDAIIASLDCAECSYRIPLDIIKGLQNG